MDNKSISWVETKSFNKTTKEIIRRKSRRKRRIWENNGYKIQFFSPPDNQLGSQSLSKDHSFHETCEFHGAHCFHGTHKFYRARQNRGKGPIS